jgi:hypothetical protein
MEQPNVKKLKDELHKFAQIAYEREKETEIDTLSGLYNEWKNGKLDDNGLKKIIDDTHDLIGKNIWKTMDFDDEFIVTRAIYKNIIKKEEISPELYDSLQDRINALFKLLNT